MMDDVYLLSNANDSSDWILSYIFALVLVKLCNAMSFQGIYFRKYVWQKMVIRNGEKSARSSTKIYGFYILCSETFHILTVKWLLVVIGRSSQRWRTSSRGRSWSSVSWWGTTPWARRGWSVRGRVTRACPWHSYCPPPTSPPCGP